MTLVEISTRNLIRLLLITIAFIVLMSLIGLVFKFGYDHDNVYGFVPKFDLEAEANIPAWYSSTALFVAALLLWFIGSEARAAGDKILHWRILAITFLAMSIDESAAIHEQASRPLVSLLQVSGMLHFAWIIPGSIFVVVFALIFIPFLRQLPRRTMILFVAAGALFVGGAIGVEALGGNYIGYIADADPASFRADEHPEDLIYSLFYTVEEIMEMLGVVLFIYALLDYIRNQLGGVAVSLGTAAR